MPLMDATGDIAIIGMACLLPGARDYHAFWSNILAGKNLVTDASEEWCNGKFDPDSSDVERIYTKRVGQLGDLAEFDPLEFGVVPNAVPSTEPDHLLALKLAAAALKDSGYDKKPFDRTTTGIVLGRGSVPNPASATAFQHCLVLDQTVGMVESLLPELDSSTLEKVRRALRASLPPLVTEAMPGLVSNVAVGRIANRLDLQGPSYLIDAACSSSLIAMDLAMKELRSGQSRMMLAGGVQASMPPQVYMLFCKLNALSRSDVRPFDKNAEGTVLSEGVGFLVLKRLANAESDGDRIYAVLKAVGVASDGRAQGLLAPRLEGETLAIQRAYEQCGIDPASVGLIEAHGTGIPLGDQTEIAALLNVFGKGPMVPRHALGSVKSMIGHCIPAAGVASLIKTVLALYYKILPPTRCEEVNGNLNLENSPFYINNVTRPWIHPVRGTPRRAGINGFGFGGINAHVVLEEYPTPLNEQLSGYHWPTEIIVLSADSAGELAKLATEISELLARRPDTTLTGLAKALSKGGAKKCRLAIIAGGLADLREKLEAASAKISDGKRVRMQTRGGVFFDLDQEARIRGKTAFVFPGQGSQYTNMLGDLYMAFPGFRRQFDVSDTAYDGVWRYRSSQFIFPPPTCLGSELKSSLEEEYFSIDVATETVFSAGLAMYYLLSSFGLFCDIMLGHSTGEYTALLASGAVTASGAEEYELRAKLNRIYRNVNTAEGVPRGSLLTVGAVEPDVLEAEVARYEGRVLVTIDNCPHQKILFGPPDDIADLTRRLRALGGICQSLPFNYAYHTPLLEPMRDTLLQYYRELPVSAPTKCLFSCSSLTEFPSDPEAIREMATLQWYRGVRFRETIEHLYESQGVRVFVEVGPSSYLTAFIEDTLRKRDFLAVASNDRTRSGLEQLQRMLGRLWCQGFDIDFSPLYECRSVEPLDLNDHGGARERPSRSNKVLDLNMPNMILPDDLARELRRQAGLASMAKAQDSVTSGAPQNEAPRGPVAAPSDDAVQALIAHERLMQEFLASQQRCIEALLAVSVQPDQAEGSS
jgi:acyl transferase domain-containing protein